MKEMNESLHPKIVVDDLTSFLRRAAQNEALRTRIQEEIKYQWKLYNQNPEKNINNRSIAEILGSHIYEVENNHE